MSEINNKLKELSRGKKSNWASRAGFRLKNQKWLDYSNSIALRVLAAISDKKENNEEMNQKILAEKIGVSPQQINKVVKGQENLTLETIAKLSVALGVELITFPEYKYSTANIQETVFDSIAIETDFFDGHIQNLNASEVEPTKGGQTLYVAYSSDKTLSYWQVA